MDPLIAMLPNTNNHEDYQEGADFYIENYLKNNLGNRGKNSSRFGHLRKTGSTVDISTEYSLNNFGYRGSDWTESANILTAGCSNTSPMRSAYCSPMVVDSGPEAGVHMSGSMPCA